MIGATSPLARISVSAATAPAVMVAVFLLLAGHNRPGGGFAAGLLVGAVIVVRAVAGLSRPIRATPFLGIGGLIVGATAIAPLLWGDVLLDQVVIDTDVAILGTLKTGSALVFDIGVVAIVVGLILAVLDAFGTTAFIDPPDTQSDTAELRADRDPDAAAEPEGDRT